MALLTARRGSLWTPQDAEFSILALNPKLWVDASQDTGAATRSTIPDFAGVFDPFVKVGAAANGLAGYSSTGLNGLGVYTSISTTHLKSPTSFSDLGITNRFFGFIVCRRTTTNTNNRAPWFDNPSSSMLLENAVGSDLVRFGFNDGSSRNASLTGRSIDHNEWRALEFGRRGDGANGGFIRDNVQENLITVGNSGANINVSSSTDLSLFFNQTSGLYWLGAIAEMLIFLDLTLEQEDMVLQYLLDKWGL